MALRTREEDRPSGGLDDASLLQDTLTALASPATEAAAIDVVPVFEARSIAAALVDEVGRVVCASPAFTALGGARLLDPDLLRRAATGGPAMVAVEVPAADGGLDTAMCAYARAAEAQAWRLPPDVKAAAVAAPQHIVVLTCHAGRITETLEAACRAYGLSGLQTRVTLEAIRTGHARGAAAAAGVSFHTAREALAEAMRRAHVTRFAALVEKVTSLTFGVLPQQGAPDTDLWGLTSRQAAMAGLIASGLTRKEVGRALDVSDAVVKKEMDQVYLVLQVGSAAALARKVVETHALMWLTRATGGDVGFIDTGLEPLRFVPRPDGSRIALSDYGPASGRPVLVVHSSMATRIVTRSLLRALQAAGFRPIAIDRPGFGLTDEVAGARPGEHCPFATAASDAVRVLDHLKIARADIVGRGGAWFVLALHRAAPERLGRVVLVNPGLKYADDRRRSGLFGVLKDAFLRNPAMIRIFIAAITRQLTYGRYEYALRAWLRASPPDAAATHDPDFTRDYFRALRLFATGRVAGFINEQTELRQAARETPVVADSHGWRVLVGAHDDLHGPAQMLAYWRAVLPAARFRVVEEAGRLLAFTHPQHVVEALLARE